MSENENRQRTHRYSVESRLFGKDITNIRKSQSYNNYKQKIPQDTVIVMPPNPQNVSPYVQEIYRYCRSKDKVLSNYFPSQSEINHKMRAILVDWLVDVHHRFNLVTETLFLAVYVIDTYLQTKPIQRSRFQLLGITALFIASKYCEIYPPQLQYYSDVTDKTYVKQDILEMEGMILTELQFQICVTSANNFYERYSQLFSQDQKAYHFGQYILQLLLLDHQYMEVKPSLQACAVLYLIQKVLLKNTKSWPSHIEQATQYSEGEIRPLAKEICGLMCLQNQLQAVQRKFSSTKFSEVSRIQIQYK